jgi:hypothetical protein
MIPFVFIWNVMRKGPGKPMRRADNDVWQKHIL